MDESQNNCNIIEGDFVVVTGTTVQNSGKKTVNRLIAQVIAVGEYDVFLKCTRTSRVFKRPLQNCYKIPTTGDMFRKTKEPALGDLVLSYHGGMFREEKRIVGILIELVDNPPNDFEARILCGDTTHLVPLNTLIVIEGR